MDQINMENRAGETGKGKEFSITLKINRHMVIGLVIGLVIGSIVTVLGASFVGSGSAGGGGNTRRTVTTGGTAVPDASASAASVGAAQINIDEDDHIRGNSNAEVVLVEYSDFECPFCQRHHPTMKAIMDKYGDRVAWVYKHFPLSFHPQAMPAALASECASEQGKFWEFADRMFEEQEKLGDAFYRQVAGELGLNAAQFDECYTSRKYADKINADAAEGQANGATGTPATFVNGTLISGAVPQAQVEQTIDSFLGN